MMSSALKLTVAFMFTARARSLDAWPLMEKDGPTEKILFKVKGAGLYSQFVLAEGRKSRRRKRRMSMLSSDLCVRMKRRT